MVGVYIHLCVCTRARACGSACAIACVCIHRLTCMWVCVSLALLIVFVTVFFCFFQSVVAHWFGEAVSGYCGPRGRYWINWMWSAIDHSTNQSPPLQENFEGHGAVDQGQYARPASWLGTCRRGFASEKCCVLPGMSVSDLFFSYPVIFYRAREKELGFKSILHIRCCFMARKGGIMNFFWLCTCAGSRDPGKTDDKAIRDKHRHVMHAQQQDDVVGGPFCYAVSCELGLIFGFELQWDNKLLLQTWPKSRLVP